MTKNTTIAIKKDTLGKTVICLIVKDAQISHTNLNLNNKHIIDLNYSMGQEQTMQLNNILMTKPTQNHSNLDILQFFFKPLPWKKSQKKRPDT